MRRSDREIKDVPDIIGVIKKCDVCRLGLCDGDMPYVVPLNFGYEYKDSKLTLFFHSAAEGQKHDIIRRNPKAFFEMDCSHKLIEAEEAAKYTMEFESVMGCGIISYCTEKAEKIHALERLMNQYAGDKTFDYPDRVVDSVTMLRLDVSEFTGKRLKKP